jgi:hypothetical protein
VATGRVVSRAFVATTVVAGAVFAVGLAMGSVVTGGLVTARVGGGGLGRGSGFGGGSGGDGAVDAGQERIDFQLVPGHPGIGLGGTVPAQHVGQALLQLRTAHRVELDVGVVHVGLLVGPLTNLGRRPLPFQYGGFGVGTGALVALGDQEPHQIPTPVTELAHRLPFRRPQQRHLLGDELGTDLVVQSLQRRSDGVDMTP